MRSIVAPYQVLPAVLIKRRNRPWGTGRGGRDPGRGCSSGHYCLDTSVCRFVCFNTHQTGLSEDVQNKYHKNKTLLVYLVQFPTFAK